MHFSTTFLVYFNTILRKNVTPGDSKCRPLGHNINNLVADYYMMYHTKHPHSRQGDFRKKNFEGFKPL